MMWLFLLFDILLLIGVFVLTYYYNLEVFSKHKKSYSLVLVLSILWPATIALVGYERNWWTKITEYEESALVTPLGLSIEELLFFVFMISFVIVLWEVLNRR